MPPPVNIYEMKKSRALVAHDHEFNNIYVNVKFFLSLGYSKKMREICLKIYYKNTSVMKEHIDCCSYVQVYSRESTKEIISSASLKECKGLCKEVSKK